MRTEVKIGLAVGLALVLIVVVYFAVKPDEAPPPDDETIIAEEQGEGEAAIEVDSIAADQGDVRPTAEAESPGPAAVAPVLPEYEPIIQPEPEPIVPVTEKNETEGEAAVSAPPIIPPAPPPIEAAPAATGRKRTYTVKAGDAGFWAVAQAVYGDGKHWTLIRDANPEADSNTLRPGQVLVIPPLSKPSPALASTTTPPLLPPDAGSNVYTVKAGDKGFWGIAEKVYGHGKYWPLIRRANPDVDSYSLRVGQRLLVPPLKKTPGAPAHLAAGSRPAARNDTYVVQAGDAGFWGIAEKVYGNGKYHTIIATANPGVNPRQLRQGQVLNTPPLPSDVTAGTSLPRAPRPPRAQPPADDKPFFD